MKFSLATVTHTGRRAYNQDTIISETISTASGEMTLLAVLDGMGGMNAGDRASQLAAETFQHQLQQALPDADKENQTIRKILNDTTLQAHKAVKDEGQADSSKHGMGTTLVAALTVDDQFMVVNVGDSRAYLWDPLGDGLQRLTRDHSLREEAVRTGTLTPEEAEKSPLSHALTRSIGAGPEPEVDLFPEPDGWYRLPAQGAVMLCSDGLVDGIDDKAVEKYLAGARNPQEAADFLLRAAFHGGSRDNITVAILSHPDYGVADHRITTPPMIEDHEPATDPKLMRPDHPATNQKPPREVEAPVKSNNRLPLILLALAVLALVIIFIAGPCLRSAPTDQDLAPAMETGLDAGLSPEKIAPTEPGAEATDAAEPAPLKDPFAPPD